jgi:hypothetical protein
MQAQIHGTQRLAAHRKSTDSCCRVVKRSFGAAFEGPIPDPAACSFPAPWPVGVAD